MRKAGTYVEPACPAELLCISDSKAEGLGLDEVCTCLHHIIEKTLELLVSAGGKSESQRRGVPLSCKHRPAKAPLRWRVVAYLMY